MRSPLEKNNSRMKNLIISAAVFLALFFLGGCANNDPVIGPYSKTGKASWYSVKITATGEKFSDNDLTCAMRKTDFGKYYKVCNTANNKCVVVRHNNFGPSKYLYDQGRIIDLSRAAFLRIADLQEGIINVRVAEVSEKIGNGPESASP